MRDKLYIFTVAFAVSDENRVKCDGRRITVSGNETRRVKHMCCEKSGSAEGLLDENAGMYVRTYVAARD